MRRIRRGQAAHQREHQRLHITEGFTSDEKSQIQALDRSARSCRCAGHAGEGAHDYARHGTTTLFAAFNIANGTVIWECTPTSGDRVQGVPHTGRRQPATSRCTWCATTCTHKTPNVKAWLAKHPRFHPHFTPTRSSWLNLVEGWFASSPTSSCDAASTNALRGGTGEDITNWINSWN